MSEIAREERLLLGWFEALVFVNKAQNTKFKYNID
jgi:hypothetical protein